MPNRKLAFKEGGFYHIFSRGNRREKIFFTEEDYQRFLTKVEEYRKKYSIKISAYCLLPNHFHLLLKQDSNIPVSKFVGTLLNSYARYAGVKYDLPIGHVFQGRFGAKLVESENDLLQVSRYIHLNPIKEKVLEMDFTYRKNRAIHDRDLFQKIRSFPWSSYSSYIFKNGGPVTVSTKPILNVERTIQNYRKFVESKISDSDALNLELF